MQASEQQDQQACLFHVVSLTLENATDLWSSNSKGLPCFAGSTPLNSLGQDCGLCVRYSPVPLGAMFSGWGGVLKSVKTKNKFLDSVEHGVWSLALRGHGSALSLTRDKPSIAGGQCLRFVEEA